METSEEAIAARRPCGLSCRRTGQQEASGSSSGNANMKKALSKKAQMKKAPEEHMGQVQTSGGGGTGGRRRLSRRKLR